MSTDSNTYQKDSGLVSVIIPTHNRSALLIRAISSVLSQSYDTLEIIVVDDNSTDDTRERVGQIDDRRIRYIRHSSNKGGSGARNTGIRMARGEYTAFLDDDDEWWPDKIEKQLRATRDFDVILCRSCFRSKKRATPKYRKRIVDRSDLKRGYVFGGGSSIILARTSLIKKEMFDETLPSSQDWDLLVRLLAEGRACYLDDILVTYNDGGHERITTNSKGISQSQMDERMRAVHKHREFLGPYWYRYNIARRMLRYLKDRERPAQHIWRAVRRCGILPVLAVLGNRVVRRLA